jgi:iron complex transport system substrate-binding protein
MQFSKYIVKTVLAVTLALGLGAGLSACSGGQDRDVTASETATVPQSITITDMTGREVTLDGPAQRVIALAAADCEIIYELGAQKALVARGEWCDYPAAVLELPAVETGGETNVEQIIALEPDVVIMSTMAQSLDQVAQLEAAGIEVLASMATDLNGVYEAITMIGAALGYDDAAASLVESMQSDLHQLQTRVTLRGATGEGIYFEVSPLEYGLWAAGSDTFMHEIATMLGLENSFADVSGWAEVSQEQVIARDPAYIVTVSVPLEGVTPPADEIVARCGWNGITAVANGDVWCLGDNELTRPGPRLVDGAQELFDLIYG